MEMKIMREQYDIIIVGAGPAGTTAAIYAAKLGLKTLLLEKETFPRDKICGDALSGKSIGILREMDLLDQVQKLPGADIQVITFSSPNHDSFNIDMRDTGIKDAVKGFVIRREIFDQFMHEQAIKSDIDHIEGFAVSEILSENGLITGVRGKHKESGKVAEFKGRIILGADGYNSIVARRLKLYEHDPQHWVVALRCYYKNVAGLTNQIELHYVDEVIPGYFWIFPAGDGYANVGIGMLHQNIKKRKVDLKQALKNAIESPYFSDRFAAATAQEEPIGWNLPVGSKRRKSTGDGFMLLGDAAGLIDPFTGEGIGNAMYSGKFAAQTAAEAIKANDVSDRILSKYEDDLWAAIGNELRVSSKLQKIGQIRFLLNFVIKKAARSAEVSNIIAGMLANEVPRKRLANPLFYLRLLFN